MSCAAKTPLPCTPSRMAILTTNTIFLFKKVARKKPRGCFRLRNFFLRRLLDSNGHEFQKRFLKVEVRVRVVDCDQTKCLRQSIFWSIFVILCNLWLRPFTSFAKMWTETPKIPMVWKIILRSFQLLLFGTIPQIYFVCSSRINSYQNWSNWRVQRKRSVSQLRNYRNAQLPKEPSVCCLFYSLNSTI